MEGRFVLEHFRVARFRLTIIPKETLFLPEYKGSTFRGGFGCTFKAGGILRGGRGNHVNIKMPNGLIVTIPKKGELKIGLLKDAISKANLTEQEFKELL